MDGAKIPIHQKQRSQWEKKPPQDLIYHRENSFPLSNTSKKLDPPYASYLHARVQLEKILDVRI